MTTTTAGQPPALTDDDREALQDDLYDPSFKRTYTLEVVVEVYGPSAREGISETETFGGMSLLDRNGDEAEGYVQSIRVTKTQEA